MWLSESTHFIAEFKQFIVEIALCAFVLIGATRLILVELHSLIPLYKKVKASLKEDYASDGTLLSHRESGASSEDSATLVSLDSEPDTSAKTASCSSERYERQTQ